MLIAVLQYMTGYLRIRVEGYSSERFLNLCSYHGIYLWDLMPCNNSYEMNISVRGFRKLKPVIRKTRTKVVIIKRTGFPFFLHRYRRRKIFFAGLFLGMMSVYIMSLFIWNIKIDGNLSRTDEEILEFLEKKGISHGMLKARIDCEKVVKDIRKEYDDIIWASAYLKGTRLMIKVKENSDRVIAGDNEGTNDSVSGIPSDIFADKDGLILEIITREGVPMVHAGDEVKQGDLLVSGTVEVLNDSKEAIGYQYYHADATIIAQTVLEYEDVMPVTYEVKKKTGEKSYSFYLETENSIYQIGEKDFSDKNAVTSTRIKRLGISENFYLPYSFGISVAEEVEPVAEKYSKEELREKLSTNFHKFCVDLEKKGVQILKNNVKIYFDTVRASARGNLTLSEQIGENRTSSKKELPLSDANDTNQEGN